jgi:hypothetical protein
MAAYMVRVPFFILQASWLDFFQIGTFGAFSTIY